MNFLTPNSPYYHLLKYLLFLLKHPVYIYIYGDVAEEPVASVCRFGVLPFLRERGCPFTVNLNVLRKGKKKGKWSLNKPKKHNEA